mgnify:FL=1
MSNLIKICMGSSCFARGNHKNLDILEEFVENHNLDIDIQLIESRCENK